MRKNSKSKKIKETIPENAHQYLAITTFVDDTYENEFFVSNSDYTIDNIAEHIANKHNQFFIDETSPEPKVKEIILIELTKIHHYRDLDVLFNEHKQNIIKNKEENTEASIT